MKQIWKFTLKTIGSNTIQMPIGSTPISVGVQGDHVVFWAEVQPANSLKDRTFLIIATGDEIPKADLKYIGTTMMKSGFVCHIYEIL